MSNFWNMVEVMSCRTGIPTLGVLAILGVVSLLAFRFFMRSIFSFTVVRDHRRGDDPLRSVVAWIVLLALTFGVWQFASMQIPIWDWWSR